MRRRFVWLIGGIAGSVVMTACSDSPFGGFGRTIDGRITSGDTAVFRGTTTTFIAVAQYDIGPGEPQTVAWDVTDESKLRLDVVAGDAHVMALDTGQAQLVAHVNGDFVDSVTVTVVQSGMVRWRRALAGPPGVHPALDDSGAVHVLGGDGNLWAFRPTGDTLINVASCISSFGPVLNPLTYEPAATGTACTRQHDRAGIVRWTAGFGDFDTAPAVAADGATIVLSYERDETAGVEAVVVSRLSGQGTPIWRDTLASSASENAPKSAPAIDINGDIYVTWRTAGTYHLTRFTGAGVRRWTIALPEWAHLTTPAIGVGRVAVGYNGGMAVYDTAAGGELWSKAFTMPSNVSSPVIDRDGNVYIQTLEGLFSYASDGALRWAADSLGGGSSAAGVGAPTLLVNGDIVVHCGGAVCGVEGNDGSLQWRAPVTDVIGSAVVTLNGQIYVTTYPTQGAGEVIALWGNVLPGFSGWPTEGANQQRSRRRQ